MISVGLAQARPNYSVIITEILPIVILALFILHAHIYMPRSVSQSKCSGAQNVQRTNYASIHGPSEIFSFRVIFLACVDFSRPKTKFHTLILIFCCISRYDKTSS